MIFFSPITITNTLKDCSWHPQQHWIESRRSRIAHTISFSKGEAYSMPELIEFAAQIWHFTQFQGAANLQPPWLWSYSALLERQKRTFIANSCLKAISYKFPTIWYILHTYVVLKIIEILPKSAIFSINSVISRQTLLQKQKSTIIFQICSKDLNFTHNHTSCMLKSNKNGLKDNLLFSAIFGILNGWIRRRIRSSVVYLHASRKLIRIPFHIYQ